MSSVKERFLRYVQVETTSCEANECCPSTPGQKVLGEMLARELRELGVKDARMDGHGYVYGSIPAKGKAGGPVIGLIAHVDTSDAVRGATKPQVIENYDGGTIRLLNGVEISGYDFLPQWKGHELIVTSGDSVLGADDKAGVAEIMTAVERLLRGNVPHGPVAIGFCPDEEVGHGAALMDLDRFGAALAYTLDGAAPGEIEYENFNAAAATVTFRGFNVHPGSSKDTMVNASLVAMQFNAMLPAGDTPRDTEGYEGFFHLTDMSGNVEKATLQYIVRDHDAGAFEARKRMMAHNAKLLNARYGEGTVTLALRDQYRNMVEAVKPHFEVVEKAMAASRAMGVEMKAVPIRGGTDGAQLSFRGLPCPNLPTGSYGHHGPYEHAVAEEMEQLVQLVLNIVQEFTK